MKRVVAVCTLACFALCFSAPAMNLSDLGPTNAEAKSKAKPKLKTCRSRLPSGKIKTWRCKANQPCCVNHTMSIYVCGSPIIGCF